MLERMTTPVPLIVFALVAAVGLAAFLVWVAYQLLPEKVFQRSGLLPRFSLAEFKPKFDEATSKMQSTSGRWHDRSNNAAEQCSAPDARKYGARR
jgi:hypothetical protein